LSDKESTNFLAQLKNIIEEVANGNFDIEISESADNELNELAGSFNNMVDNLKKTIKDLRNATLRYVDMYDSSTDLRRSANADNTIIDCNKAYAESLGYTKEEIIGKSTTLDHCPEMSIDDFKRLVGDFKTNQMISNRQIWFKRKDGSTFPGLLSSTMVHDKEGNVIGSNAVIKDVSEIFDAKKKIEESETQIKKQKVELQEEHDSRAKTELKYRNLYDGALDLFRVTNADNIIIDCNKVYAEKLGYTKEEVIGKKAIEHTAEVSMSAHLALIKDWKKTNRITNREIWLKRKDGSTFPTYISATALHDEDGNLIASNTIIKEITELYVTRKKFQEYEAQIKQLKEELKAYK